jgi:transposase
MRPISVDLRTRILKALEEEPSSLVIAARFKVGASSVRKLRLRVKRTGAVEADSPPGRERLVQGEHEKRLRELVRECPDATLNVLCELLLDETGVSVSETTMWRQLERMGITLKKRVSAPRRGAART